MPTKQVVFFLVAIMAVILLASAVMFYLAKKNPQKNYKELNARINSWWVMFGIVGVCVFLGETALLCLFALISLLALKEFFVLNSDTQTDQRIQYLGYASIPIQYFWVSIEWYGLFVIFIPVYMFLLIPFIKIILGETEGFLKAVGTIHWGLMLAVFSLSHLAYLIALPEAVNPAGGIALMLFLLVLTQLNDVAQFLWGKALGEHKITPKVSPNKTTAGLLGGIVTITSLACVLGPWLTPMSILQSFGAGLIISVGGFVGDVTMSAIKRDIGVKDTGSLLPGHGGMLDRVDSLTFSAPLFFHYLYYLHY